MCCLAVTLLLSCHLIALFLIMAIYVQHPSFFSLALLDWGVHILSLIILIRWLWSLSGSLASASAFRRREIICREVNTSITLIFKLSTVSAASVIGHAPRPAVAERHRRAGSGIHLLLSPQTLWIAHQLCNKQTDTDKHNGCCAAAFVRLFCTSVRTGTGRHFGF